MQERLPEVTVDDLRKHIDTIEESYEFFLAYAPRDYPVTAAVPRVENCEST